MKKIEKLFNDFILINTIYLKAKELLDAEIIKTYGFHYSDKDMDYIIDTLDHGRGKLSFKKFDKLMKDKGGKK